jgi:iron complex outermembrane recepter protein
MPIVGATAYFHETRQGSVSDSLGQFTIIVNKAGHYHLHIELTGYQSYTQDVWVGADVLPLTIVLKESAIELTNIVIEADPFKHDSRQQSLTIESIDSRGIQKNLQANLLNSLTGIAGFNTINVGVGIAKPVIRGMSMNRVMVIEQGIKQEGQQWGADHGLEIDQFNVARLEILKGPSAIIYGADAMGGLVQIRPEPPKTENGIEGNLKLAYQSLNHNMGGTIYLAGRFERFFASARFSAQDYGDFRIPATQFNYNRYILKLPEPYLKNTAGKERNYSLMAGTQGRWGTSTLTLTHFNQYNGIFAGAFGIPRQAMLTPDGSHRNIGLPAMDTDHLKIISNSHILIGKNWLEMDLGYQQNLRQELARPHTHGFSFTAPTSLSLKLLLRTISGNVRYHYRIYRTLSGITGVAASTQHNEVGGFEFFMPQYSQRQAGIYSYCKWNIQDSLFINAGVRLDRQSVETRAHLQPIFDRRGNQTGTDTLVRNFQRAFQQPAYSLGLSYWHRTGLNFKLNLASMYRFPAAVELASNGIHHGTFRHEQGEAALNPESGYQLDFSIGYENRWAVVRISPFVNWFDNYIYLTPMPFFSTRPEAGQVYRYQQTTALNYGGEVIVDVHFWKNLHCYIGGEAVVNYNWLSEMALPFTPPPALKTEVEYTFPSVGKRISDWYLGVEYRAYANQTQVDRNELATPGYTLFNLKSGFTLGIKQQVRIYGQVQNLLNTFYFQHLSRYRQLNLPEPGRNFVLSVEISFASRPKARE